MKNKLRLLVLGTLVIMNIDGFASVSSELDVYHCDYNIKTVFNTGETENLTISGNIVLNDVLNSPDRYDDVPTITTLTLDAAALSPVYRTGKNILKYVGAVSFGKHHTDGTQHKVGFLSIVPRSNPQDFVRQGVIEYKDSVLESRNKNHIEKDDNSTTEYTLTCAMR